MTAMQASSSTPRVTLQGGINFRDLGGIRNREGRRLRHGMLFRSGALNELTEQDCQQLAALPLTDIVDYRDTHEAQASPDKQWPGARYHSWPANPLDDTVTASLSSLEGDALASMDCDLFMRELYRKLPFNNPAYRRLVDLLLHPEPRSVVQHCAVGKDRTGVGVALVLFALDVDKQTVLEDYLATDQALAPFRDRLITHFAERCIKPQLADNLRYILSAREHFLMTALDAIDARYGSVVSWLEVEYGLDAAQRVRLQERYLETA